MKQLSLAFLFMQFIFLDADFTIKQLHALSSLSYIGDDYPPAIPRNCSDILESFADSASKFTKCSIEHARPIRLCERCIDDYVAFELKYKELMTTEVNGTTCRSIFISHDRLDTVFEFYNNIQYVWDKGNCENCFDRSVPEPVLSNSTRQFISMFNDTMECITDNLSNNTEQVCQTCMDLYIKLDEYYKTLSIDAIGVDVICMDIVDSMNITRSIWSKGLNCCQLRKSPQIVFLCCTAIICFLPILFYLAVRYCGPIRDLPKVLMQSRFNQRFFRTVDGNVN